MGLCTGGSNHLNLIVTDLAPSDDDGTSPQFKTVEHAKPSKGKSHYNITCLGN
jgi:hypothetical protein